MCGIFLARLFFFFFYVLIIGLCFEVDERGLRARSVGGLVLRRVDFIKSCGMCTGEGGGGIRGHARLRLLSRRSPSIQLLV